MKEDDSADYKFTVKEGQASKTGADDAPTYLACEPMSKELRIVGTGHLYIVLKAGTKIDRAQEVAEYLQSNISEVRYHA